MSFGLTFFTSSYASLSLSRTGGGKLQIRMSETAISRSSAARASACLRSSTMERLFRESICQG